MCMLDCNVSKNKIISSYNEIINFDLLENDREQADQNVDCRLV